MLENKVNLKGKVATVSAKAGHLTKKLANLSGVSKVTKITKENLEAFKDGFKQS